MTDFDYQKFLKKIHSQHHTPMNVIKKIVKRTTSYNVVKIEKILKGEANEVYNISLVNNDELILRISRNETNPFIPEQWAMEKCRTLGVPVAKILGIDEIEADGKRIYTCILSKIEGVPLREVEVTTDTKDMHTILAKAGYYLSLINSVKTDGFGHITTGNGKGEKPTYRKYLMSKVNKSKEFIKAAEENNLSPHIVSGAFEVLLQNERIFINDDPILAHGDMGSRHIMVKDNLITGIIDFGNMRGSFPVHDFAWWDFWNRKPKELEWLKEGYNNKSLFENNYLEKFHTIKLLLGLELLYWNNFVGHMNGVKNAKLSLQSDLEFFKKK